MGSVVNFPGNSSDGFEHEHNVRAAFLDAVPVVAQTDMDELEARRVELAEKFATLLRPEETDVPTDQKPLQ